MMKGFVFTMDAIVALIIVGFAVSIVLYVNFSSPVVYQPTITSVYTLLQNLAHVQLGTLQSQYAQYASNAWNASTYTWAQAYGTQSLASSAQYGPQAPGLIFNYTAPTNVYKLLAAGSGIIAFYSGTYLDAINATSGKPISGFPVQEHTNLVGSPIIYNNEIIYANSTSGGGGFIGAVSTANGASMWAATVSSYPTTPIAIEDGYLVFGSSNTIYLLNPYNGTVFAKAGIPWPIPIKEPAYANGEFAVVTNASTGSANYLYSYSLAGNYLSPTWVYVMPGGTTTNPLIGSNIIAVGDGSSLYVVSMGGSFISGYNPSSQIKGISAIGDKIYGTASSGIFYYNPFPSDNVYSVKSGKFATSENMTPASTPGIVYALSGGNNFQAYSPELKAMLWNVTLPTSSTSAYSGIALAYGNAYVASGNKVYAFGTCKANPTASVLEDLAYMYLNGNGACADLILSSFYSGNAAIFINNTYAPGMTAAQFNGQSSYIQTPALPALTSSWTITGWVYVDPITNANEWGSTAAASIGQNYGVLWEGVSGSTFRPFFDDNGVGVAFMTLPTARWILLAFTYNGVGISSYAYTQSQVYNGSFTATTSPISSGFWYIGKYEYSGEGTLNGSLANVQIYNTSLSASQVQALYQEGIGGAPIVPANIVAWYPLNGNANDYSGNSNTGFPTNVVYVPSNASSASIAAASVVNRYSIPMSIVSNGVQKSYSIGVVTWH